MKLSLIMQCVREVADAPVSLRLRAQATEHTETLLIRTPHHYTASQESTGSNPALRWYQVFALTIPSTAKPFIC